MKKTVSDKILEHLEGNSVLKSSDLAKRIGADEQYVRSCLKKLKKVGKIERSDDRYIAGYVLVKEDTPETENINQNENGKKEIGELLDKYNCTNCGSKECPIADRRFFTTIVCAMWEELKNSRFDGCG